MLHAFKQIEIAWLQHLIIISTAVHNELGRKRIVTDLYDQRECMQLELVHDAEILNSLFALMLGIKVHMGASIIGNSLASNWKQSSASALVFNAVSG